MKRLRVPHLFLCRSVSLPVSIAYTYEAASNRTGYTAPDSSTNTYSYDTLNRLTTLANSWAGSFGFSYDALSRRTQMTRPNGVATNYTYDNLSRLLSVLHQAGSTIDGATYTLDSAGNRTAKTDQLANVTTNYTYDAIYELLEAAQGGSTTESYSYDPVGNRLSSLGVSSYTNNSSNELTATSNASYTYDYNGNMTSKTDSTGTTTYTWDFENRLASVILPGNGGTVSFKYDPFGRRIEKTASSATSIYAYDSDNVVETTNGAGAVILKYAQGQAIDEPLAESSAGATSYYEVDGLGSVTSLSSSAGALAQTYTYDSFGKPTASSGSLTNPFQYTGREFDTETGFYYYRARYYDPTTGRFLSEDPSGFDAGIDFYSYAANNPVLWNDPLGLVKCTYSITAHTLDCTSNDGTLHFHTDHASSGRYKCRNNSDCQKIPFNGPTPVGEYRMGKLGDTPNPHPVPRIMLFPKDGTNTFNRNNLEVHQGWNNQSEGCITIFPPDYPAFMHFYLHDNSGTTKVAP